MNQLDVTEDKETKDVIMEGIRATREGVINTERMGGPMPEEVPGFANVSTALYHKPIVSVHEVRTRDENHLD